MSDICWLLVGLAAVFGLAWLAGFLLGRQDR